MSHIISLRLEIFTFRQKEKESLGAALGRINLLSKSDPNLAIPNPMLLQHFHEGLNKEAALYLDIAAGESFAHKTLIEEREILDRIIENTSFLYDHAEPL
ncbi:hypothetical protein QOZ80_3BG0273070 [Eleusine coracana subsp. coracana]|nr:hypothetical protein QOZ80_3BG0273070 [Eleusine coracana subsp. coracana]